LSAPLLAAVHERGPEPAVSVGGRGLTSGELRAVAAALAAELAGAERVAVWAESTLEACVASVAALCAGIPLVPVNPKLGRAELEHVLSDSRPDAIVGAGDAELPDAGRPPRRVAVDLDARGGELPVADAGDEDPALVIYTSGTTGRPKGAVLPRRAIASNLDGLAEAWEWTGDDVLAHGLPLFHVHGLVLGLFGPLRRGGELRHLGRFEPAAAAAALEAGATMLFGVPTMYHRLGRAAEEDGAIVEGLKRARLLVSGSAPLPAPEFARIEQLSGMQVVERYGLTETLMNTAVRADSPRRPGYVGVPVPGVELRLVADDGSDIADSDDETIGEVAVRGPNLFSGYLNRPDATAEAMRDGWFFTGDLATRAPDGYWRIVGRRSTDLIKTGGYKVGAGEIEVALIEHPGVLEAAVTGEPDPDLGERIVAWVVADGPGRPTERELIDHVAGELAPHKRPREVRFLDELPRNPMGKVVKQRLGG
jgi:malonyl-CoA/methylmalonyl-CoA synthetase